VEGTIQERTAAWADRLIFSAGIGVDRERKMPPPLAIATDLLPSAEEARQLQFKRGALLDIQVVPESVEEKMELSPRAMSLPPSAEEAMDFQWRMGELLALQESPELAEV